MTPRSLAVRAILLPVGLAAAAGAGPLPPLVAPQTGLQDDSAEPRLVVEGLDGEREVRPLRAGPITSLAAIGAAFVHFEGVPASAAPGARIAPKDLGSFELAGGDRLAGAVRGGDGDLLSVELRGGVPLDLTIDAISSVVFPGRIPDGVTSTPGPGPDGDRLYLVASGSLDLAQGFVEAFTDEGVTFEDERLGARTFAWDRVAALFITALEEEGDDGGAAPTGEPVAVSLRGGGRLSGRLRRIAGPTEGVDIALGGGAEVSLPGRVVSEVALDDGSFRFLGDLVPSAEAPASLFGDDLGFAWPMRVDRNVRGGPLVVAGRTYLRGMGVHAPSRLEWELEGAGWRQLRVRCGVDDTGAKAGSAGAVRFRVLGDDELLWQSDVVRAGAPAQRPPAMVLTGVSKLVLEVDPAGPFTLDRADWLRPMLVR
ncbi:MAG: NPCBM/NEW2 domain-containing protein [Planctomycetota bacterium]|nr:NPCBM/NEW2 domain-containing protein [Planctomycetota bacterium]